MIELIISGGQSGVDQAGWRAARRFGLPTGGWMPRGFKTEAGSRPEFARLYNAREHPSPEYPPRTRANIEDADGTLIFDTSRGTKIEDFSRGTQLAMRTAYGLGKPNVTVVVELGGPPDPKRAPTIVEWIREEEIRVLNVAGNRESTSPGIGAWVEAYLCGVFRALGLTEAEAQESP